MYPILVENVSKTFVNHKALNDVSLKVLQGSIFGLLGPNGAGKTTLIRIINQIYAADCGRIEINGEPLNSKHIEKIGYLPEERGLYKKMKVGEQAVYLAQLKGLSKHDALRKLKYWFEKFEIQTWWGKKVEELSKGMAQKVQFIVTVIHEPSILIFDEPFSGFDPINANLLKTEMLELQRKGATIIFSTHNMSSVEELCSHVALINRSQKILDGQVDEIKAKYRTNMYEIEYTTGTLHSRDLSSNFTIESQNDEGKFKKTVIKSHETILPNELIKELMPKIEINSFREMLPSMNDIFIRVVQENIIDINN